LVAWFIYRAFSVRKLFACDEQNSGNPCSGEKLVVSSSAFFDWLVDLLFCHTTIWFTMALICTVGLYVGHFATVLWIRDILVRIRIPASDK
jgi:hypothetical protein